MYLYAFEKVCAYVLTPVLIHVPCAYQQVIDRRVH